MAVAPQTGIILFAHGSRDPHWRLPIEAVAERVRGGDAGALVACAYLELTTPDLATAADDLVRRGAAALRIFPLFLGVGRHAREDLPKLVDALRIAHPTVGVELLPAAGEDERLVSLLADIARS
ncbi:MAG: cobalamin biosynthesis protein CbiX [Comamonadaceae bacterium]|nr:MAG: cobalamin biosynthesis protein CbiX [Comamonadaceae bacterium]